MFIPKRSQNISLKILSRYLKQTKGCGLVLNPNSGVYKLDTYPDADFSGVYIH